MYYENFEKLCEQRNVKPAHVSRETGVKTATLTSWKKGVYTPKQDKLQLIADYFNVSVDYLMNGKESNIVEMVEVDVELTNMSERMKEYALKMANLSKENQELLMQMIDKLN